MTQLANLADAVSFEHAKDKHILTEQEVLKVMLNVARQSNQSWGSLDKEDGYNCLTCRNKGEIYKVFHTPDDACYSYYYMSVVPCKCMEKRQGYQRTRMSGLPEGYTFDTFRTDEDWQRSMRDMCEQYYNERAWKDGKWLYVGGGIGTGKTHIVSALARELVYGQNVVYMNWVRDSRELKAVVNDNLDYSARLYRLINCDVLFIDDFFKSGYITDADKRLAYDILNDRYNNHKATLFTSEMFLDEIPDEALSGRIYERAKDYIIEIARDQTKDQRRL